MLHDRPARSRVSEGADAARRIDRDWLRIAAFGLLICDLAAALAGAFTEPPPMAAINGSASSPCSASRSAGSIGNLRLAAI
jgi:hypothetical protein